MMAVLVIRGDVQMCCTTEEQLNSFLEDGYVIFEEKKAVEKPKTATKTTKRKTKAVSKE